MRLCELRETMRTTTRSIDAALLTVDQAKAGLKDVIAIKNMAATLEGRLARRVADASEWERAGFPSAEAWLAHQTGTSQAKAKEALETAKRLEQLPAVNDAAEQGVLSPEQAAAVSDAATADPSAEQRLLDAARHRPLSKLKDDCANTKRNADPNAEATYERIRKARMLRFVKGLDGAARLFGATTPDQMAPIKAAVEWRANELFHQARREGRDEPRDAYLMDALADICRQYLTGELTITDPAASSDPGTADPAAAADNAATIDTSTAPNPRPPASTTAQPGATADDTAAADHTPVGDATRPSNPPHATADDAAAIDDTSATGRASTEDQPAPTASTRRDDTPPATETPPPAREPAPTKDRRPERRSKPPAWLGLLRIDIEALQRGSVDGDELCEITGLGPVPISTARRLLGDAVLKLVITRGVDVLHVTHLGRSPTIAQKIALLWQSPGCSITSCARMAGIQHDHDLDWAQTRHTRLDELRRFCDHHHDLKTYEGWAAVKLPDATIDMVPPEHPRHPRHARAGPDPPTDAETEPTTTLFDHDAA